MPPHQRLCKDGVRGALTAYQYDPAGNRTQLTWPETAFYVTTTFDALNRPTAIKETGTVNLATYAYDDLSRRTTVTLGNGTTTSYGYSTQGALASLAHNLTGTAQDQPTTYTRTQLQATRGPTWTNALPCCPGSRPPARTAWAAPARRRVTAMSISPGARPWPPTWWWSITTCCSPTWR
mgnify:CR=1 FL=1